MTTPTERASHTPGTWRVGDAGNTIFGPPNGNPSPETIARNVSRRYARLIAAAPELLEACESFIAKASVLGPLQGATWHTEVQQARAAITKAKGQP